MNCRFMISSSLELYIQDILSFLVGWETYSSDRVDEGKIKQELTILFSLCDDNCFDFRDIEEKVRIVFLRDIHHWEQYEM